MPTQPVYVTIGGKETLMNISVPSGTTKRVQQYLTEYFQGMREIDAWRIGYQTNAAKQDLCCSNIGWIIFKDAKRCHL